jgi:NAD-dependent deacetylase
MNPEVEQIAAKLSEGGRNVFFTGAGISTESGIPDYRSQGGLWQKYQPVYFDDFMNDRSARVEYWRRQAEQYPAMSTARPNSAHMALYNLYRKGLLEAVITQNIDGLHQASGIPEKVIIELHGNAMRVRCIRCREISSIADAIDRVKAGDVAPECRCGGYLKPDTISFGQAMPEAEVQKAAAIAGSSAFFGVVGSTLLVQPAAQMPVIAKNNGAFLAIINLSETPCDRLCDVHISGTAGVVLSEIISKIST